MKASEVREKSDAELVELEASMKRELFKSRFSNYSNQLDNTSSLPGLRRDIARVKTEQTARAAKKK